MSATGSEWRGAAWAAVAGIALACGGITAPDETEPASGETPGGRSGAPADGGRSTVDPPIAGRAPTGGAAAAGGGSSGGASSSGGGLGVAGSGGLPNYGRRCSTPPRDPANPACSGNRIGLVCPMEGQLCPEMSCGLHDLGCRTCRCDAGVWSCTACDFSAFPWNEAVLSHPGRDCVNEVEFTQCSNPGEWCRPVDATNEVCLCWPDDRGLPVWDCDAPPRLDGSW